MAKEEATEPEPDGSKGLAKIEKRLLTENPNLFQGISKDKRQQLFAV